MASLEEMQNTQNVEETAPKPQVGAEPGGGAAEQAFMSAPQSAFGSDDSRPDDDKLQLELLNKQRGLMTKQMAKDQMQLLLSQQKQQDDNLIKALLLRNNQNQVLNNSPYINAENDLATAQRRAVEELKYQQDYFTRAEQQGIMYEKNQYLTQQIASNELWGIPSLGSELNVSPEYFANSNI